METPRVVAVIKPRLGTKRSLLVDSIFRSISVESSAEIRCPRYLVSV
jgi:hypothetical protein